MFKHQVSVSQKSLPLAKPVSLKRLSLPPKSHPLSPNNAHWEQPVPAGVVLWDETTNTPISPAAILLKKKERHAVAGFLLQMHGHALSCNQVGQLYVKNAGKPLSSNADTDLGFSKQKTGFPPPPTNPTVSFIFA